MADHETDPVDDEVTDAPSEEGAIEGEGEPDAQSPIEGGAGPVGDVADESSTGATQRTGDPVLDDINFNS